MFSDQQTCISKVYALIDEVNILKSKGFSPKLEAKSLFFIVTVIKKADISVQVLVKNTLFKTWLCNVLK